MNAERKVPRELRPDGPLRAWQGWVRLQEGLFEPFGLVLLVLVLALLQGALLAQRAFFLVLVLLFPVFRGHVLFSI